MQPQSSRTFIFFGIVGSGKGTQAKLLIDALKAKDGLESVYAYPGAEFRKLIETKNFTANLIKDSIEQGSLQPDFLTNSIFADILIRSLTAEKHLIADGFPRTVGQSEAFVEMMKFYKRDLVKIIFIEIGREEAMKRNLLRGRSDDTEDALSRRFDEYLNNVIPAMDYFKGKEGYEMYPINGEQSVEDVHKEIIRVLGF